MLRGMTTMKDRRVTGKLAGGWQWERVLHGIVPPLISPLDDAGAPDAGAMAALVEHVVGAGCTGLFMLGGCGEGAWLTPSPARRGDRAAAAGGRRGACRCWRA